jgi:glycosyltransferase involved in cell wall biosynthesis
MEAGNARLAAWLDELGLREHVSLLGERSEAHALMPAFDIATLSSCDGEGFPNVIGEAMCWGIPCAVTDVGDSAYIVGDTGKVIRPGMPEALAAAWQELVEMGPGGRRELGEKARARMKERFSLDAIAREYSRLYATLARKGAGNRNESREICQKATY